MNFNKSNLNSNDILTDLEEDINNCAKTVHSFFSLSNLSSKYNNNNSRNIKFIIILIAFFQGLFDITNVTLLYYQKNVLHLSPVYLNYINGLLGIPWCIKPVIGFLCDKIRVNMDGIKPIIIFSSLLDFSVLIIFYIFNVSTITYCTVLFMHEIFKVMQLISAETLLVVISNENKKKNPNEIGKNISFFFAARTLGSLFGNILGGNLYAILGYKNMFLITSLLPIIIFINILFYKEAIINNRQLSNNSNNLFKDLLSIKDVLYEHKVYVLFALLFVIGLAPNFDSIVTFYFIDKLRFTPQIISNLMVFSTLSYFIGIIIYNTYFVSISQKKFYIVTNFLICVLNFIFLLFILGYTKALNINDKFFCFINQGVSSFIMELNSMPVLIIICELCPKDLEGTTFAFLSSLLNLSAILSNYFGSLILLLFNINSKQYSKLWILILIQSIYYLIFSIFFLFIKFPNFNKTNNNSNTLEIKETIN